MSFLKITPPLRLLGITLASLLSALTPLSASVTVNAPLPITHNVVIQPILTKHSNGETAMFLGNSSSESYIKGQINSIWAQSGITITWLTPIEYANDFAYNGSPSNYSSSSRPTSHLGTIVNNAGSPPKSPNATIINMFFVEIVPGFNQLNDNYANGLAYLDYNGICMHVGRNLVGWTAGRDAIASVMGHEIGHNLGLSHYSGSSNLMASADPDSYLLSSQTNTVFTNNSGIDGYDFLNPAVTESNYSIWAGDHDLTGGPEDDDDGDGISNIIEFVLNLNPGEPSQLPAPTWSASGLTWSFSKNTAAAEDGIEARIEISDNCGLWSPAGTNGSSVILTNTNSQLSARLNSGLAGCFMRLKAEIPQTLLGNAQSFTPEDVVAAGTEANISCCSHGGCGCQFAPTP